MEFNKPVSNPMMVGSIELLKAEDTPEHRQMFLDELQKAKFLSPVVIDPVPVPDENGRVTIARDAKVQFPCCPPRTVGSSSWRSLTGQS